MNTLRPEPVPRKTASHRMLDADFEIRKYFTGAWRIKRRIIDRRAALSGRFTGQALIEPDEDGADHLIYRETGTMIYGDHQGPATQSYRWRILAADRAEIRFSDGRFFHLLDLAAQGSIIVHECAPDRYLGRVRINTRNSWQLTWHVTGPRKDQLITSLFQR